MKVLITIGVIILAAVVFAFILVASLVVIGTMFEEDTEDSDWPKDYQDE